MKYNALFKLLKKHGWREVRQKGSHVILQHPEKEGRITVPYHTSNEVKKGLLKSILKQTGIKIEKR